MAEKELKWYDILEVLFGIILSIADPITDVLTLVEFYRTDHKTWFSVGLTFIILPSLFFLLITDYFLIKWSDDEECQSKACKFTHVLVLGCNPLYPAWLKLQTLYCYLKKFLKLRQGSNTAQTDKDLNRLLWFRNSVFWPRPLLRQLPSLLFSCTPWLFNSNRCRSFKWFPCLCLS